MKNKNTHEMNTYYTTLIGFLFDVIVSHISKDLHFV